MCEYRLWPPAFNFDPKELAPVAAATISCLVKNNSKVLWVPSEREGSRGQWFSASEACYLGATKPNAKLLEVGRRAGLLIPDAPATMCQVRMFDSCQPKLLPRNAVVAAYVCLLLAAAFSLPNWHARL